MQRGESKASQESHNISHDDSRLQQHHEIVLKCRDRVIHLGGRTRIMGVLNVTPDSFYDGGKYLDPVSALRQAEKMVNEGADILDVGGESTRPGSDGVSEEEELRRVIPVIREIRRRFDIILSVDTTKERVAREALEEGVEIVNDISGLKFGHGIADAVSKYGAGLVLMHTTSRPKDMQSKTQYVSLIDDIISSLRASVRKAVERGVDEESILVDPGFGFGKTAEQNLSILKHLRRFGELGRPVLIGTSNKSFIGQALDATPGERMEGTAATVAMGILNGASVIRVHDVARMKRASQMADAVLNIN